MERHDEVMTYTERIAHERLIAASARKWTIIAAFSLLFVFAAIVGFDIRDAASIMTSITFLLPAIVCIPRALRFRKHAAIHKAANQKYEFGHH